MKAHNGSFQWFILGGGDSTRALSLHGPNFTHYIPFGRRTLLRIGSRHEAERRAHPDTLAVFLTENRGEFTFPNGKKEQRNWKAGQAMFIPAEEHLPENLTDSPLELVLVEFKK